MTKDYTFIPQSTLVLVDRNIKNSNQSNQHGPMPLKDAEKQGLFSSSSGTVQVFITVAPGEDHAGENVFTVNDRFVVRA